MAEGGYRTRSKSRREAIKAAERDEDFKTTDVGVENYSWELLKCPERLIW